MRSLLPSLNKLLILIASDLPRKNTRRQKRTRGLARLGRKGRGAQGEGSLTGLARAEPRGDGGPGAARAGHHLPPPPRRHRRRPHLSPEGCAAAASEFPGRRGAASRWVSLCVRGRGGTREAARGSRLQFGSAGGRQWGFYFIQQWDPVRAGPPGRLRAAARGGRVSRVHVVGACRRRAASSVEPGYRHRSP